MREASFRNHVFSCNAERPEHFPCTTKRARLVPKTAAKARQWRAQELCCGFDTLFGLRETENQQYRPQYRKSRMYSSRHCRQNL